MSSPSLSPTTLLETDCTEGLDWKLPISDYFWGVTFGLLGSIAINTGNNLQSYGMKQLHEEYARKKEGIDSHLTGDVADEATEAILGVSDNDNNKPQIERDIDELGAAPSSPMGLPTIKSGESLDVGEPPAAMPATTLAPRAESLDVEGTDGGITDQDLDLTESKTWLLGTCIFLVGSTLNFSSYGLAAQSVLASLEAIQFVTNLAFSKCLLQVRILPRMVLGTVLICGGTILTVVFGNSKNEELSFNDIKDKYANPLFVSYLSFIVVSGIGLQLTHKHYQKMEDAGTPLRNSDLILPVTYAVFSAYFGTMFVVQAKVFMKMSQYAGASCENLLTEPLFYITIVTAVPLVAIWLHRLNEALSLYEPLFIIPLIQSNFIIWAIISGGIYFEEFAEFKALQWFGFVGGLVIILCGLYQLRPDLTAVVLPDESSTSELEAQSVEMSTPRSSPSDGRHPSSDQSLHMKRSVGSVNTTSRTFLHFFRQISSSGNGSSIHSLQSSPEDVRNQIKRVHTLGDGSCRQSELDENEDAPTDTEVATRARRHTHG